MDLLTLSARVEEKYRSYLKTTFHFKDPELRDSFKRALESEYLKMGPYLEATHVFQQRETPRSIFNTLLGFPPEEAFLAAVQADRPLYEHQAKAIEAAFHRQNIIVATGTGSGKTESFLYPILLHLYQEFAAGRLGSGVRALILYPMNALANDQRNRLGDIANRLTEANAAFRFTFGQYTGETPEDENDSRRFAREHLANRLPGELVLRSEIRDNPPHILLTNFSMLEYLLLRPYDSPLFDDGNGRWWKFIVLDEAHQYRGALGIEMGMLLRRLKQRIRRGGRTEPFSCIATSATLAGGDGDKPAVADFAANLFDEQFLETQVILAVKMPIADLGDRSLPPESYGVMSAAIKTPPDIKSKSLLASYAAYLGVQFSDGKKVTELIGNILLHDFRATKLRKDISDRSLETKRIAAHIFPELAKEEEQVSALSRLVDLLLQSQDPYSGAPLLSARYHLFMRSLEGAFVSYWPKKQVFLDRKATGNETTAFEVALCRECGQHYFVGRIVNGMFVEAVQDPANPDYGGVFLRPFEDVSDEIGDGEEDVSVGDRESLHKLCIRCGAISSGNLICGHDNPLLVIKEEASANQSKANQISKCSTCGYSSSGRDPVRGVLHGTDGPNAVIATALYQNLPVSRKKVLAFSDARQEAAFFAWYLEESYRDILSRNCILRAIRSAATHSREGISLKTLANHLVGEFQCVFRERESDDDLKVRGSIWRAIYREYLTDEWRISLEGVGLLKWCIKLPNSLQIPDWMGLHPWSLSEEDANILIFLLLNFMRNDRATEIRTESGIPLSWKDLALQAQQMSVGIGPPRRPKGAQNWNVRSWDGKVGKRGRFLLKLLQRKGLSETEILDKPGEFLRRLWETLQESDRALSPDDRLLLSINDSKRLNPEWWRLFPVEENGTVYQCNTCGRLHSVSLLGLCTRHNCEGTLEQTRLCDCGPNHYRTLYGEDLPGVLRVEEHTAQLGHDKAKEFQADFKKGRINVLSCSTTFELGVDLGDLDTVFLRNVPPEAFNYAQRVGRSGRRKGYPGFALTYCRRNSHDLYHFAIPERILSGRIRPPILSLKNEKIITRHIVATALSLFFRYFSERFKTVQDLLGDFTRPSLANDFMRFLTERRQIIETALCEIVPPDVQSGVGLSDGSWVCKIAGEGSRILLTETELANDLRNVHEFEARASRNRDYKSARWAQKRAETIENEDVLSALSRKAVIPKYGFPVDVVQLDTFVIEHGAATEVSLQRDLSIAISEFAPQSKLIANKKVWTSYGIKRLIDKEWDRRVYKKCAKHNFFGSWKCGEVPGEIQKCCDKMVSGEFIIPQFGFVTNRDEPKSPTGRTLRQFSTRPYFLYTHGQNPETLEFGPIRLTKASPGLMVVLCEGRRGMGFYICEQCGAGPLKREARHKTPYGEPCQGTLSQVSLGHEFTTDVVQLQFRDRNIGEVERVWFTYSLAYALLEAAAEVMEIPSSDLNTTVAYGSGGGFLPPIILYDNLPGGAGLVARLQDEKLLYDCLVIAQKRVSGDCGCDENTSCYGCLRSYRNQFAHNYIQRGLVMRYLDHVISEWH